jgi:hypothetical protein
MGKGAASPVREWACRRLRGPFFCWGYRDFSVLFSVLSFEGKYGEKTAKAVTEENGVY